MNLCSHNHEEICHETRKCPVCEIITEHEREVDALKDDVSRLENRVGELESELEATK